MCLLIERVASVSREDIEVGLSLVNQAAKEVTSHFADMQYINESIKRRLLTSSRGRLCSLSGVHAK